MNGHLCILPVAKYLVLTGLCIHCFDHFLQSYVQSSRPPSKYASSGGLNRSHSRSKQAFPRLVSPAFELCTHAKNPMHCRQNFCSAQVAEALRDCESLTVSDDGTKVKRTTVSQN